MKKLLSTLFLMLIMVSIISCTNEEEIENENLTENLNGIDSKNNFLKETSLLVGTILNDNKVKDFVDKTIKESTEDHNILSFSYLLDNEKGLRKDEVNLYKSKDNKNVSNPFRDALHKELLSNNKAYPVISKKTNFNRISSDSNKSLNSGNDIENLLVESNLQIFFPYGTPDDNEEVDYSEDDMSINEFYVTYEPTEFTQTNTAFKYSPNGMTEMVLHNDFLDDNPVYVISPMDQCDIRGQRCNLIELDIYGDNTTDDPYSTDPDPLENSPTLLTYNVNHNNIPETDIISTVIPKIKINGTSYMGFGGTHQKLRFVRGTTDGSAITQNSNGTITASGNDYKIKDFRCKRKYLKRKKRWLSLNGQFDPDWNMSENTQVLGVFSLHRFEAEAKATFTAKSGFKVEADGFKPSTEGSGSVTIEVKVGSAKFRANTELSRRQTLSTIVGPGITGNTISDNGVDYNVKKIGIIDFYLKHYYTDLTD